MIEKRKRVILFAILGVIALAVLIIILYKFLVFPPETNGSFTIAAGGTHKVCWNSVAPLTLNAQITASNPVDIYFTPSVEDANFLISNSEFLSYQTCYVHSISMGNAYCVIDGGGCIIVSNINGSQDSKISLDILVK